MKDLVLGAYAHTLEQAQRFVNDVPDERFAELPHAEAKHPAWVLSHLALAGGMAAACLLRPDVETPDLSGVPGSFYEHAAPGTSPLADRSLYAPKDQILSELERVHRLVADAFAGADDASLAAPFPIPEYRSFFPTQGVGALYFMAQHEGYHLGQLSAWRYAAGFGSAAS